MQRTIKEWTKEINGYPVVFCKKDNVDIGHSFWTITWQAEKSGDKWGDVIFKVDEPTSEYIENYFYKDICQKLK